MGFRGSRNVYARELVKGMLEMAWPLSSPFFLFVCVFGVLWTSYLEPKKTLETRALSLSLSLLVT